MRELAVFGRTAHPALAVEICADLGVRCAASQASSAAAWRCCLVAAPGSATPRHDEFPDELGQGCEDVEDQPAAWGGGVQSLVPDRNPVPRRRTPATMVIRSCRGRDSRSRPGMTRVSPARR